MIELDLFRHHRLALDHGRGSGSSKNFEDDVIGLFGVFRPVHLDSVGSQLPFQLLEQLGLFGQTVVADRACLVTQGLQFGVIGKLRGAPFHQPAHSAAEVAPDLVVIQRLVDAPVKGFSLLHGYAPIEIQRYAG